MGKLWAITPGPEYALATKKLHKMLRNPIVATILSTCYLLVYIYLLDRHWDIAFTMFIFSPIVVIWLVYTILRYGKYRSAPASLTTPPHTPS